MPSCRLEDIFNDPLKGDGMVIRKFVCDHCGAVEELPLLGKFSSNRSFTPYGLQSTLIPVHWKAHTGLQKVLCEECAGKYEALRAKQIEKELEFVNYKPEDDRFVK